MKFYHAHPEILEARRLDPYYYDPIFVEHEQQMKKSFPQRDSVGEIFHVLDGTHDSVDTRECADDEFAVTFLRSQDIGECLLRPNAGAWLRHSDHICKCKRSKIYHGDVLLNIMASTGQSCLYFPSYPSEANANRAVGILRSRDAKLSQDEKLFISVLLSSRAGGLELARNLKGSIQQRLNLSDISDARFPRVASLVCRYVGEKVRHAERMRTFAELSSRTVMAVLDNLVPEHDKSPQIISRVSPKRFGNRLDCQPYRTHFMALRDALNKIPTDLLSDIAEVLPGDPVPSEEFATHGVPLARIRDINVSGFQNAETFVSDRYSSNHSAGLAQANDIIVGMDGEFRAQMILAEELPRHINQRIGIVRATGIAPSLLSLWMNRREGQFQLNQWSVKTTVDHTSLEYIRAVRIPRLSPVREKELADLLNCSSRANYYSRTCVSSAKLLVESLIERRVTEDEIIHAQTRLEQDDVSADRAILSRLFEGGWDATETRPLFPDLDAYYDTLRMVEREQTEVTAK